MRSRLQCDGRLQGCLEATVRYLAYDMGPQGAPSTHYLLAPSALWQVAGVEEMLSLYEHMAPLGEMSAMKKLDARAHFCSVTTAKAFGEILHVDGGYHAMGSPGRLLDKLQDK